MSEGVRGGLVTEADCGAPQRVARVRRLIGAGRVFSLVIEVTLSTLAEVTAATFASSAARMFPPSATRSVTAGGRSLGARFLGEGAFMVASQSR